MALKRIEEMQTLSGFLFSCLKNKTITNCFLSQAEWKMEIAQKNVDYFWVGQNLFLLRKRKDFWILNYAIQISEIEKPEQIEEIRGIIQKEVSLPIVVEVVSREAEDEKYQKQQIVFQQLGMKKVIERERFHRIGQEENMAVIENETLPEIVVAKIDDLAMVWEFLSINFSKYYGCIPVIEKLREDIENQFVFLAKQGKEILGILHFKKSDKMAEIRHLAVDKNWRGKGIAKRLMEEYERKIILPQKLVWTGAENQEAQGLYQKYGYQKDGYVSSVFSNVDFFI